MGDGVKELQWYVVRAIAGQENKAKQYLESEIARLKLESIIQRVVIPTEKVFEIRNGKKRTRERSYLPGYILLQAQLEPETIQVIRDVPGIIGFPGHTRESNIPPQPLRESEVNKILGKVEELSGADETMENPFRIGEGIKVMDGPFSGFTGAVEEVDEVKKKLRVSVKIFGRVTPLELNFLQVERV
jgi:transcription termination/antitermination protein NusG